MTKKKLSLVVRPRLIWASIIVILSFTTVFSYIFKEQERELRVFTQDRLIAALEETFLLQSRLLDATHAKARLESELRDARQETQIVRRENEDLKLTIAMSKEAVKLDDIIVQKTGQVTRVRRDKTISVNLGTSDDIKEGDIISVYRDNEFIGKAEFTDVNSRSSSAFILPDWQDRTFKKGDEVRFENK